uniref:Ubiquitin-like domain-containing protein n=1 Tax=Ditylenchus dipsaci TaxID=166011 RepID=A0A915EKZ4_9BILA
MRLTVNISISDWVAYEFEVNENATVKELKQLIQSTEGYLYYQHQIQIDGCVVSDDDEISENLNDGSVIYLLHVKNIMLFVKWEKQYFCLDVETDNSVASIKNRLRNLLPTDTEIDYLCFAGEKLADKKTLGKCKLDHLFTIHLNENPSFQQSPDRCIPIRVLWFNERDHRMFWINRATTVGELKEMIQLETKLLAVNQILISNSNSFNIDVPDLFFYDFSGLQLQNNDWIAATGETHNLKVYLIIRLTKCCDYVPEKEEEEEVE